jgi:hypothetical protein
MIAAIVYSRDRFPLDANVCTNSKNIITFGHERHAPSAFKTRVSLQTNVLASGTLVKMFRDKAS